MKVALATYLFGPCMARGAVEVVWQLAQALVERGIEVVVITTHGDRRETVSREGGMTVHRFLPWNLYWVRDKDRYSAWQKIPWQLIDTWNVHSYRVVRRLLSGERPDVMHVHKLRGMSPSIWAAAQAEGVPVIQSCHGYELISPEGTLTGRVGRWARSGSLVLRWYTSLRVRASRGVAAATAPSRYVLGTITGRGFFPAAVQQVIPNSHGLTQQELSQRLAMAHSDHLPEQDTVRVLYLGRLEPSKGVELLCTAFERSATRCPALRLDVAGGGTLESSLRRRYGGHPQMTFHGVVVGAEKEALLGNSDVVVVPSVWPEAFGLVTIEALAAGTPVIASEVGALPELVRHGETGYVLPTGDVPAWTEALCRLAERPDVVRSMRPACFDAAQHYSLDSVVDQYVRLYERTLKKAEAPPSVEASRLGRDRDH